VQTCVFLAISVTVSKFDKDCIHARMSQAFHEQDYTSKDNNQKLSKGVDDVEMGLHQFGKSFTIPAS
jgi:hypothetical protein